MIRAIIFDLGNTIIQQQIDGDVPLDRLELVLIPYVRDVLPMLAAQYRLALVSNTTQSTAQHVRRALTRLNIAQYFSTIVTSFDHNAEKPDPKLFRRALQTLHCLPAEAIMVGNDPAQDIDGARAVGMRTALFAEKTDDRYPPADLQFSDFRELPRLIRALGGDNDQRADAAGGTSRA